MSPTFLGEPFYPAGIPLRADAVFFADKSMRDIWLEEERTEDEEKYLKEYIIYYMNAPLFIIDDQSKDNWKNLTADELIDQLYEHGLDPF